MIEQQAKPEVAKLTSQMIINTGNEAGNNIVSHANQIDGMALTASRMTRSLPKDGQIINDSFSNLITNLDKDIIESGTWYDPNTYQANAEQRAFV